MGNEIWSSVQLLKNPLERRLIMREFKRELTHTTTLFWPKFVADTNAEQFQGLIDVINGVLLLNDTNSGKDAEAEEEKRLRDVSRRGRRTDAGGDGSAASKAADGEASDEQHADNGRDMAEHHGSERGDDDTDDEDEDEDEYWVEQQPSEALPAKSATLVDDDDVPELPEDRAELQALLDIGLREKAIAEAAEAEAIANEALSTLDANAERFSDRSRRVRAQRRVIAVVEYGIGDASWTLRDHAQEQMVTATMRGLHGQHHYRKDASKLTLFDIALLRLASCRESSVFKKLVRPNEELWRERDRKRDRLLSIRTEIRPPPEATLLRHPALRRITFWDHVEIKLFPLTIQFPHDHYAPFRSFFFPVDDANASSTPHGGGGGGGDDASAAAAQASSRAAILGANAAIARANFLPAHDHHSSGYSLESSSSSVALPSSSNTALAARDRKALALYKPIVQRPRSQQLQQQRWRHRNHGGKAANLVASAVTRGLETVFENSVEPLAPSASSFSAPALKSAMSSGSISANPWATAAALMSVSSNALAVSSQQPAPQHTIDAAQRKNALALTSGLALGSMAAQLVNASMIAQGQGQQGHHRSQSQLHGIGQGGAQSSSSVAPFPLALQSSMSSRSGKSSAALPSVSFSGAAHTSASTAIAVSQPSQSRGSLLGSTDAVVAAAEEMRDAAKRKRAAEAKERAKAKRRAGDLYCFYFRYLRVGELELRLRCTLWADE